MNFRHCRVCPAFLCLHLLALPGVGTAQGFGLGLSIAPPSAANEFTSRAMLEWPAGPERTYIVQSTDALDAAVWKFADVVQTNSAGPVQWRAPEALGRAQFYRVILPQPAVFDLQPAFVDTADPDPAVYLIGQMLPAEATVMINGIGYPAVAEGGSGTLLRVSLKGLPPGTPILGTIFVVDNATGSTNSQYTLMAGFIYATEPTTPIIQGPPEEPPASPLGLIAAYLSKRGYDYYKAQSDLTAAGLHHNPAFQENNNQGQMPSVARAGKVKPMRITCERGQVNDPASRRTPEDCDDSDHGVFPATGEFRCQQTDLAIPGRMLDFAWTRTYRSRTSPDTAQGAGWDFSFNVSLAQNGDGTLTLRPGNGRADTFYPDGTNGWIRDEYFVEVRDLNGDGFPDVLFADTGKWLFHPPGTPAGGKLAQIMDRNGNAMTLGYDGAGRLATIVDDLGRTNTVAHNPLGLIESITDFTGRAVRYEYNGNGDLVAVISPPTSDFPGGITNRYTYSSGFGDARLNHNLTSCIDGKGQTQLLVTYSATNNPAAMDFDTVISTQRGIEKKDIKRGMVIAKPSNRFATTKVIVRDALGNVSESYFDSRQRCVRLLEYTGRAPDLSAPTTETENRPVGKLRADDPDYFETQWAWNPDSLCTLEVRADGGQTEIVHQRVQDHNSSRSNKSSTRRHEGNVRVVRERAGSAGGGDLDGDGAPDITELAWYFEYDPRFGSPGLDAAGARHKHRGWDGLVYGNHRISAGGDDTPIIKGSALGGLALRHKYKGWDGLIYGNHRVGKGWDGTIKGRPPEAGARSRGDGGYGDTVVARAPAGVTHEYHRFATRVTDPRGNVTTTGYDAQGNNVWRMRKRPELLYQAWEESLAYNARGQLTAITNAPDADGFRRVDTFNYYASGSQAGQLQSVVIDDRNLLGLRLTTSFEYDSRGNVTRCVDPRTNDWLYTYNALDQCVRAQSPVNLTARGKTDFFYDANGNVTQVADDLRDENDNFVRTVSTLAQYDALDRCMSLAEQVSPGVFVTNKFFYDGNDQLTLVQSPLAVSGADPHAITAFEYDERGLLFREIGAPGSGNSPTNEWSYDARGRVRVLRGPDFLRVSAFSYDGLGRLASCADPMGNETRFNCDRAGNLTRVRHYGETNDVPGNAGNRLLAETRYTYDALDRCVQQMDSFFDIFTELSLGDGMSTTTFAYAPNGACTSVTDDNGRTTRYAFDAAGRLASVTDPKTNIMQFTYDAGGNATAMVFIERPDGGGAEQQFSRTYAYDALGRCVQTADNVGNTTRNAYDSLGNLVVHTDALTNDTVFAYDDLGRRVTTTSHVGARSGGITINTTHVEYDTNGRVISSTDGNKNTTVYAYDSLDRCVSVTLPDGTSRHLVWSPRSNLIAEEDANGTTITNTYDLCDRLIHRDIAARGGAAGTTSFETFAYDGLSRCVSAANDSSTATFAFDSLGNCVRSTQDGLTTTSTFDGVGNCTAMTYPSGGTVSCTYDALDQLSSLSHSAGGGLPPVVLASYAYDGPGRLARVTRANGVETRLQWNGKIGTPNAAGDFGWRQVSGVSHQQTAGARTVLDRRVFAYDRSQNKLSRAQTVPFYVGGATTTNLFAYDALDRLMQFTRETGGPDDFLRFYSLDPNGNRLFAMSNGVAASYVMDATTPVPADFQRDQYTITPFGNQIYDENGNLTARGSAAGALQYIHDYADRLVAVNDLGTGMPTPVATYAYDALGRRIGRTLFPAGGLPPVVTRFVYDGEDCDDADPIEEHENGSLARTHVVPHTFESKGIKDSSDFRTHPAPHVFEQKGRIMIPSGTTSCYLHPDDIGNTLLLTDAKGNAFERYDYDDFGLPGFLTSDGLPTGESSSGAGNPFLFRGMPWDAETGFYHTGGGGFDPLTGRVTRGKVKNIKDMGNSGRYADNPWSLKKEEGGRHTPFHNKRTYNYHEAWPGRWKAPELNSSVSLINPIAMDKGLRFAVVPRNILKSRFETGDIPNQDDFRKILDYGEAGDNVGLLLNSPALRTISNVLKTKHDTAKNSIGNIR